MPQEETRRTSPDVFLRLHREVAPRASSRSTSATPPASARPTRCSRTPTPSRSRASTSSSASSRRTAAPRRPSGSADLEVIPRRAGRLQGQGPRGDGPAGDPRAASPRSCIVDELAHTNVPGTENAKRYQDVEDLLEAGISVMTAVNIQHFESRPGHRLPRHRRRRAGARARPDPAPGRRDRERGPAVGGAAGAPAGRQDLSGRAHRRRRSRTSSPRRTWRRCASSRCARSPTGSRPSAAGPHASAADRARRHQGHGRDVLEPRDDAPPAAPRLGARGQAQHQLVRRLRPHAPGQPAADVGARAPAAVRERHPRHGARRQGRLALGRGRRRRAAPLRAGARRHARDLRKVAAAGLDAPLPEGPDRGLRLAGSGIDVYEIETEAPGRGRRRRRREPAPRSSSARSARVCSAVVPQQPPTIRAPSSSQRPASPRRTPPARAPR